MLAALIIVGVVVLTVGSVVKRLMDLNHVPALIWPVLLVAGVAPGLVGYQVLNPGEVIDSGVVKAQGDKVSLDVPAGYAIMVTASLNDEVDEDEPNAKTTAYSLNIKGDGWNESAAGDIRRKSAGGGPDIDLVDGQGIMDSTKRRSGKWGEDLQDRVDLKHHGAVEVTVTNWQGLAAEALTLEVVKGPPPGWVLWIFIGLVTLAGIHFEVKHYVDRVTGDLAFLALWALFLRDGVTPLDDFQRVGYALAPAALLGWGAAAGIAWVSVKYVRSKEDAAIAAKEAEEQRKAEEEAAPGPKNPRAGRRRRRGR